MLPAFIATFLFSLSVIAASRSTRLLGSHVANFGRVLVATVLLGAWAFTLGAGVGGQAFLIFFLSGCVGFGLGDTALFQTLPRLGPRLSSLLINCLSAPFAAAIEWAWLGTRLTLAEASCSAAILGGVALALAPEKHQPIPARTRVVGIVFGALAGLGQGLGAVLSRKGFAVAAGAGERIDGGTAAFQRILGGLAVVAALFLWLWLKETLAQERPVRETLSRAQRRSAWSWVLLNGLVGPSLGVGFYQWALKTTPSGVVLPITATTPLVVIPFTYYLEGDRPSARSLAGGLAAVLGVIGLTLVR